MSQIIINQCNGECLHQAGPEGIYYRDPESKCTENCVPIACPNFAFCGSVYPDVVGDCCDGRCGNCDMIFGRNLDIHKNANFVCQLCKEQKPISVNVPIRDINVDLCVKCARWTKWNKDAFENAPPEYDPDTFNGKDFMWTMAQVQEYYDQLSSKSDSDDEMSACSQ